MSNKASKHYRESIYFKKLAPRSLLNTEIMAVAEAIPEALRIKKFKEFADIYFYKHKHNESCPTDFDGKFTLPGNLSENSDNFNVYNVLKKYAMTNYGSIVINKMLKNKEKYKGFKIYRNGQGSTAKGASAAPDGIAFPYRFPMVEYFPTGGQQVDPLAIISHEFGHTIVFNPEMKSGIQHERDVVIQYENTVRKINGYEMRYVYYNGQETINIISGKTKTGKWTFHKEDPMQLVPIGSKEAYSR